MKKIAFLILFVILCGPAHAGKIQFSTYYPAPYGIYDRLRLVPRDTLSNPCPIGSMYVQTPDNLRFCVDDGAGNGSWEALPGVWIQSGDNIYPKDNTNPDLKVSINSAGVGNPSACCGDGSCNGTENCATCDTDCGACAACSGSFTIVDACGGCSVGDYFTNGNYCDSSGNDGDASCVNCLAYGNPGCVATLGYCSPPPDCVYNCVNTPGTPAPACTSPEFKLTLDKGATTPDGGILAIGTYGPSNGALTSLTTSGAGTRLIWYPKKAAFRAGHLTFGWWDDGAIGDYSVGMGYNARADKISSVAMGYQAKAQGDYAAAMGYMTTASGNSAVALGQNTTASNTSSTALGDQTTASGQYALAMGKLTTASGDAATAMGFNTTAQAYASLVLGQYNVISGDMTVWEPTHPVFVIGNGTGVAGPGQYSNALTVLKNGKTGIATSDPEFRLTLDKSATTPDGGIVAVGTYGSGADLGDLNTGTYMIWYPKRGAFRAGRTDTYEWDDTVAKPNIGNYSVAMGNQAIANGHYSVAMGDSIQANGDYSVAMGNSSAAYSSEAYASVAFGYANVASGRTATAFGSDNLADGLTSTAMGSHTVVDIGPGGQIGGTAMGNYTTATSYFSTVIGQCNVIPGTVSQGTWAATDPLFVIGNGTWASGACTSTSNAWTVRKDGNTAINGVTDAFGGLTIETRTNAQGPPPSPVDGMLWLCTDCP